MPGDASGVAVDAYWTDLDAGAGSAADLFGLLDEEERARADRFRFERDRRRFILRRGLLRTLLAGRVGGDPSAMRFTRNAFGKPALPEATLRFSASHSHGVALHALAEGVELGCDIERRDERIDIDGVARAQFAPSEVRALEHLPPEQRLDGFFRCWTRKEAYVKALGLGLSHRLDSFDALSSDEALAGWSLRSFEPRQGYHAAVAVQGRKIDLRVAVLALNRPG